jgi:acetyltransferase
MQLSKLFDPKSVAVVGATEDASKVGFALLENIRNGGERDIYPVTLSEGTVLGLKAYKSVMDIPGNVDLAVIAVRADIVAQILQECAEKHIPAAVVISAGFKEMGEEGAALEQEMARVAEEHKIALLGPNCLGIMNAQADWNASFAVNKPRVGGISFVSQSGALGTALLDWANREGVGFSKFVSLGNEAVLNELAFLEYLADDDDTKAVLLYLEQVKDGARFMDLAKRVTEKKPLVVLRAGRSERGSAAVASHTGSLAPGDKIFEAALKQVGAIPVESLDTLFALAKLFELGITEPLQSLAIVTNGGGPSVNMADLIDFSTSLSLATFSGETQKALRVALPPMAAVGNPIDVIGDANPHRYDDVLRTLTTLPDVDAIVALVTPQMMTSPQGIADVLVMHRSQKPIIPVFMGGATVDEGVAHLQEKGMVNFSIPTDVVRGLDALAQNIPKKDAALHAPAVMGKPALVMLPLEEMRSLLASYNLTLEGKFITCKSDIEAVLGEVGEGPYAMKIISRQLVHKTDLHAVRLNLKSAEEISNACDEFMHHIGAHSPGTVVDGMLIQPMMLGVECLIGMKRDATFGPAIVFGIGGVFVEVLKDSAMRVAPVTEEEALAQIQEIKGLPLLTGARGMPPVDLNALARIIAALSELALDHPEVEEIDMNPVMAREDGAHIVDLRIMVKGE